MSERLQDYYASAVQRHYTSPLTVNQVDRLAEKAQTGDKRAKDKLCRTVAGLVEAVAGKYRKLAEARGVSRDDLRQAGMLRILEKLHRWEPERGAFNTYAMDMARFGILNLINSAHLVTIPKHTADCAKRGEWTKDQMRNKEATRQAAREAVQTPSSLSSIPETPDLDIPRDDPGFDAVIDQMYLESVWKRAYLTEATRVAVIERIWGEKSFEAVGRSIGSTNQTAFNRYKRGLRMLQVCAGTRRPKRAKLAERVA